MTEHQARRPQSRRQFIASTAAMGATAACGWLSYAETARQPALIAITLDLEMSAEYPVRGTTEWNYRKGDLDEATKRYSAKAGELVREYGGVIHYFCVGQVLEQPDIEWLRGLKKAGHPIGNHTYDHVFLKATKLDEVQYRFRRAPWLVHQRQVADVIRDNISQTTLAMQQRLGFKPDGFRTPGGFSNGLTDRPDLQQMLLDQGFPWVSSKYPPHQSGQPKVTPGREIYADIVRSQDEAQPFVYPSGLIEVPMSPISDVTAFRSNYWKLGDFLKAVELCVNRALETGQCFDFLAHPSCLVVEDPQMESLKLICELVKKSGDRAKIVGLDQLATRAVKISKPPAP